jgi:RNA polymerase-binding transcription factor DksA
MDEADVAYEAEVAAREAALAEARRRLAQLTGAPSEACPECGEPVLLARRRLGLALCFDCAERSERRARLYGAPRTA